METVRHRQRGDKVGFIREKLEEHTEQSNSSVVERKVQENV